MHWGVEGGWAAVGRGLLWAGWLLLPFLSWAPLRLDWPAQGFVTEAIVLWGSSEQVLGSSGGEEPS